MMAGAADDGERTGTHGCSSSVSVVGQFDAVDIASAQGVPETYRVASYRHTIYTHIALRARYVEPSVPHLLANQMLSLRGVCRRVENER